MTHRAYVNFWVRDYAEALMLDRFERLLETVPLSSAHPGFERLVVRAVSPAETPLVEHDLRGAVSSPADVIALAGEHVAADIELEVTAHWELWRVEAHTATWKRGPEPVLLLSRGPAYDDGIAAQTGHFEADLGFEELFTGPGGVLTPGDGQGAPGDPGGAETLDRISQNIQQLFQWLRAVENALPIERYQLWSEGEENLEARLDDILAVR
jgi:hypothetical protein